MTHPLANKKVYLAGPMSGIDNFNKAAFEDWADRLERAGAHVFNPISSSASRLVQSGFLQGQEAYRKCLAIDLQFICEEAEAIFMLQGWETSYGCRAEHAAAVALGLCIQYEPSPPHSKLAQEGAA